VTPKHSEHLAALLDALCDFIRSYMVIAAPQTHAQALWVAHTHVLDAFETTPFLAVTSPEKRCGKTRLLDVLELLVARPWRAIMPSEAVLFRKINAVAPTLMLDETDAIFNAKRSGDTEPLRALLNAGNRRGATVPRCVGPTQQLVDFHVFGAKVLTGIGSLPDTIADRSIPIRLARKRPDERAQRFRRREALERSEPLRQDLESWAADAVAWLEQARPEIPDGLDDRAEEAWEPLLAIAELAGGHWPDRARAAAVVLSGGDGRDDEALGVRLLADVRDVFGESDRLSSADLAAGLCTIEESPWGNLYGKQLDARGLARRLRPFDVRPRTVRFEDGSVAKGYHREQFDDPFARYLAPVRETPGTVPGVRDRHTVTCQEPSGFAAYAQPLHAKDEDGRKPSSHAGCNGVTNKSLSHGRGGTTGRLPLLGDDVYPVLIARHGDAGHLTQDEFEQQLAIHRLVAEYAEQRPALDEPTLEELDKWAAAAEARAEKGDQ
jgi:hypothetical protein